MLVLTIRTDRPDAEIGLYKTNQKIDYVVWPAHRQLAETLHDQILQMLDRHSCKLKDLQGVIVYKGPGSFTGLRIGISVANALSSGLGTPIAGSTGEKWISQGLTSLETAPRDQVVADYGAPVHTTTPKK